MIVYCIDYDRQSGRVTSCGSVNAEIRDAHFALHPTQVEIDAPLADWRCARVEAGGLVWAAAVIDELEVRGTLRAELAASDKTQLADYPITDAARTQWAAYRQALRERLARAPGAELLAGFPNDPAGGNLARRNGWIEAPPPGAAPLPRLVARA